MKIYQAKNVYEAALERIEYIYREFPNVAVSVSGGKDSTVVLFLCLEVARKLNRLPIHVYFLDQEAEWRQTVEYMRVLQDIPGVDLHWYQIQFDIFNSTSHVDDMLHCWREGDTWMRRKEPTAITENNFGVNRFHDFLDIYLDKIYPGEPACTMGGVRTDESPNRAMALTTRPTYKHITYGKCLNSKDKHYVFYPIYDWEIADVWHYIAANNIPYNRVYDLMHQHGMHPRKMRVSCLTHEMSVIMLQDVQDICRDTWNDVVMRLETANSVKHLKGGALHCPDELPPMFSSWVEYRDYLLEKLITDPAINEKMARKFRQCDAIFQGTRHMNGLYKEEITAIIRNDHYFTRISNFMSRQDKIAAHKRRKRKKREGGGGSK